MQIFTVYSDEIKNRFDPYYYQPAFKQTFSGVSYKKLGEIAKIVCGPFGSAIKVQDYKDKGLPLIRIANVKNNTISNNLIFIDESLGNKYASTQVKPNDIVVSQRGTLGQFALIPSIYSRWNISANLIAIKDIQYLRPNYLILLLNSDLVGIQVKKSISGQVQPKITTDIIKSLIIPLIPDTLQSQIIKIYESAYQQKQQKEKEAQELLDSIDDYMLKELGITIPEVKNEMVFIINSDELENKRVDAYFHQPKFKQIQQLLASGKYGTEKMLDIIQDNLIKGHLPTEEEKNGDIKVIQISNIDKNGIIDYTNGITARGNIYNYNQMLNKDDLLIVLTGATIGKVGLFNIESKDFYLGGDLVKFKVKKTYRPQFVWLYLKSIFGQMQIVRCITGSTNKHLLPDDFANFLIPQVPIEIQNKIASEFEDAMIKAKQLKLEALKGLEQAKKQVEKMILSNN